MNPFVKAAHFIQPQQGGAALLFTSAFYIKPPNMESGSLLFCLSASSGGSSRAEIHVCMPEALFCFNGNLNSVIVGLLLKTET